MKKNVDLKMLDRLDRLIRLCATGTPNELASRLGISHTKLYETISFMQKTLLASIRYNSYRPSFEYEYEPDFYLGFEKDRSKDKND
jgi:hypothetical protein